MVQNTNAFDDVVAPSETRERIVRVLRLLTRKFDQTVKKHSIDTW
ncbi:MAG: hypothetical protein O7G84_16450 [Gammaproteobacteria bacterium]|nr:hypothetical protein [Gammaproteobacteria bacterium]